MELQATKDELELSRRREDVLQQQVQLWALDQAFLVLNCCVLI